MVDDFIDRVMADPRLNANPAVDEAHHKVPPAGFTYLATALQVYWGYTGQVYWNECERALIDSSLIKELILAEL